MSTSQFGRYEIKSELGRGGMATVFRAYDPFFKREVALKVLPREFLHDPAFRARFEREAQTVAALEHAAIVPVYDYGEENGQPYLVMRLMAGGSLADKLRQGAMSLSATIEVLERLAPALDRAHGQGIVHRDLKPANILFDGDNNPYISDFGLAKLVLGATQISQTGVMGTPAYMAPEQARGDKVISTRADIYALGVIVYHMLTGQLPFDATTPMGMAFKHITEPPPRLREARPDLPAGCDAAINTSLAKDPDQRFATAAALLAALEAASASLKTEPARDYAEPATRPPVLPPPSQTRAAPSPTGTGSGSDVSTAGQTGAAHQPTQIDRGTPPPTRSAPGPTVGAPRQPDVPPISHSAAAPVARVRPARSRWLLLLIFGGLGLIVLAGLVIGGFMAAPLLFPRATAAPTDTPEIPTATTAANPTASLTPEPTTAPSVALSTVAPNVDNLARGASVSVSGLELAFPPPNAVDGVFTTDEENWWGSGAFPPQWIEIDLGGPAAVWALRLHVNQDPPGQTQHLVYGRMINGDERLLHEFSGLTADGDVLEARPPFPWEGIQIVRIETIESPSWVAWREVEIFGRLEIGSAVTPEPTPQAGATALSPIDQMVQVYVPAGGFVMGSNDGPADQQPEHVVYLDSFWIDQTEVTNLMYARCVEAGSCSPPQETRSYSRADYYANAAFENHPVLFVTWTDARNYCEWAGRRLPTEAEWEKAARGDDVRPYPWGNAPPDASRLNFASSGIGDTRAVGQYPDGASPYGALDMAGNAWEWVADWYDPGYYAVSPAENPPGPPVTGCPEGACKALRGGSWDSTEAEVRTTMRLVYGPNDSRDAFTIRCAQSP